MFFVPIVLVVLGASFFGSDKNSRDSDVVSPTESYWFLLHRKSNIEYLYSGMPGEREKSRLIKTFTVKAGIPGERPTPLPKLLGREYWLITGKAETQDNPETAPYFLILDIPYSEEYPYGPTPYLECNDPADASTFAAPSPKLWRVGDKASEDKEAMAGKQQCDWILPGSFGLHGINGDESRLALDNPGSSGCIRHKDEDITYLYNLLDPEREKIRYYIEDI